MKGHLKDKVVLHRSKRDRVTVLVFEGGCVFWLVHYRQASNNPVPFMQIDLENVCLKFWEIIQRVMKFLFKSLPISSRN